MSELDYRFKEISVEPSFLDSLYLEILKIRDSDQGVWVACPEVSKEKDLLSPRG